MKNKYRNMQKWLDYFGVGTLVNVKAHPTDDVFNSFTGRIVGESRGFILVKNEETDEKWECDPDQISFNTDEIMQG